MMYLSYGYIINDITYQCCAYSYSFGKIGKKCIENSNNQILDMKKRAHINARFLVHISESRYSIIFYEWSINVCRFLQSLQVQSLDLPLLQRLRTMFGTLMP